MARLSPFTRFAYGSGEFGPAMAGSTMLFFQMIFLTNVAGLRPDLAGSVLFVGKIWDAVNDPLIGWLSDHTRSRWGRRLPWMAVSIVPLALFFWLQWLVPGFIHHDNQYALFAYYVVVSLVFNSFYTGFILPHNTLTPELSQDYDERSRITGFRMAFSIGGSVGGLVLALAVFEGMKAATLAAQNATMGAAIAVISVLVSVFCIASIWRVASRIPIAAKPRDTASIGLRTQFRILLSNKPYLLVCAIYLFSWLAMQLTATLLSYYVVNCMGLPNSTFSQVALAVQVTALVLLPAWGWLSVRIGKKAVYFAGMGIWILPQLSLIVIPTNQLGLVFALGVIAGFGVSVCYLIPNAMLPDTIEWDELQTGQRREGIFYGFFVFLQKTALALSTLIVGWALQLSGFIPSKGVAVAQPQSALTTIQISVGLLPAIAIVIGLWFAWRYPITKAKHAEILRQLAERRAAA
jgi:GPH family glycoside/pentoside/hexuronide:cation symporter